MCTKEKQREHCEVAWFDDTALLFTENVPTTSKSHPDFQFRISAMELKSFIISRVSERNIHSRREPEHALEKKEPMKEPHVRGLSFSPNMVRKTVKLIGPLASLIMASSSSFFTFSWPMEANTSLRSSLLMMPSLFWSMMVKACEKNFTKNSFQ
ncbi:hypothetical protein PDJAM_G00032420 [Pangasius djambal]|uniref:Uncharacterized protein n=1 Tax=Pangasius djambal TaxID=1691987 RepID=A0ACC5YRE0_9TELE|nr:hypothetical protein [Pangasius djambal]